MAASHGRIRYGNQCRPRRWLPSGRAGADLAARSSWLATIHARKCRYRSGVWRCGQCSRAASTGHRARVTAHAHAHTPGRRVACGAVSFLFQRCLLLVRPARHFLRSLKRRPLLWAASVEEVSSSCRRVCAQRDRQRWQHEPCQHHRRRLRSPMALDSALP